MLNSIYKINFKIAKYYNTLENYPSDRSRKTGFALWNSKHDYIRQRVIHFKLTRTQS